MTPIKIGFALLGRSAVLADQACGVVLGALVEAPAKMKGYAWAASETFLQVRGEAPFANTHFNPADDPSKQ